jgi:hypothetical protein
LAERTVAESITINVLIIREFLWVWNLVSHAKGKYRLWVFENGVLRRIFGRKREEEAGGWRSLHYEELHNLYASPNVITVIKSRKMRWTGHVAHMGK